MGRWRGRPLTPAAQRVRPRPYPTSVLRMPAEWSPHERTLMAWPARRGLWGDRYDDACAVHAAVARVVAAHEPVTMVAAPADADAAHRACGPEVEIVAIPIDDSWIRDSGPIGLVGAGRRAGGGRLRLQRVGREVPRRGRRTTPWRRGLADRLGLPVHPGAVRARGRGHRRRRRGHAHHDRAVPAAPQPQPRPRPGPQIEDGLRTYLGVERIIWIPFGLADDDDTDGHVDNVAAFVAPGVVLVQGCDDRARPDHERLAVDRRCLAGRARRRAAGRSRWSTCPSCRSPPPAGASGPSPT